MPELSDDDEGTERDLDDSDDEAIERDLEGSDGEKDTAQDQRENDLLAYYRDLQPTVARYLKPSILGLKPYVIQQRAESFSELFKFHAEQIFKKTGNRALMDCVAKLENSNELVEEFLDVVIENFDKVRFLDVAKILTNKFFMANPSISQEDQDVIERYFTRDPVSIASLAKKDDRFTKRPPVSLQSKLYRDLELIIECRMMEDSQHLIAQEEESKEEIAHWSALLVENLKKDESPSIQTLVALLIRQRSLKEKVYNFVEKLCDVREINALTALFVAQCAKTFAEMDLTQASSEEEKFLVDLSWNLTKLSLNGLSHLL